MAYKVRLTLSAEDDMVAICKYIAQHDSSESADYVLNSIEEVVFSLEKFPERGHVVPELDLIGVQHFKEIHFKPYRVLYEVIDFVVTVHLICDGRREMQSLLRNRLLR